MMTAHAGLPMLALLQLGGNQLNTFQNFLQTAVSGIQGSGVIAGMMNVAYVIMLVSFLWEVYQSALHGGDVKGLGKSMVKYLATALVVQAWPTVFVDVNHAFVNAGSWMTTQGGAANVLDTWMSNLKDQFNQQGFQHTWNLIAGEMAGLIDAILIFIAYLLYPIVTVIFGFFYLMMGSVLYIAGPLVISLLPLGATNRLAKAYIENVFIWNAWPLLYGALGLLISAVHLDNMQQILSSQGFLGALNGMEGSFLVGLISIVYSVAIAAIPFMAKSIVNGDVGSVARQMLAAATTAVAAGTAAVAGASAGVAAAKGGASAASGAPALAGNAAGGGGSPGGGGNHPASPQPPAQQTAAPQAAAQQPAATTCCGPARSRRNATGTTRNARRSSSQRKCKRRTQPVGQSGFRACDAGIHAARQSADWCNSVGRGWHSIFGERWRRSTARGSRHRFGRCGNRLGCFHGHARGRI